MIHPKKHPQSGGCMYLLFDFDGTLVDSFDCVMKKAMLLATQYRFKCFSTEEINQLRDLSSKELIKTLNIPIYRLPQLIHHMRKHLRQEMPHLPPATDIYPVVKKLKQAGFSLGILTSNSIENVSIWLESHQMKDFFNFIHNESNYFSKRYLIKKTIKTYQINKERTFYIGDETRDIEAAHKNHIQSVAVTWGYNSEKALSKYAPSFIARHPDDLLSILLS